MCRTSQWGEAEPPEARKTHTSRVNNYSAADDSMVVAIRSRLIDVLLNPNLRMTATATDKP